MEVFEGEELITRPFLMDHLEAKGGWTLTDLKATLVYMEYWAVW